MEISKVAFLVAAAVLCVAALGTSSAEARGRGLEAQDCSCSEANPHRDYQLIRGQDQVAACDYGRYCDCGARRTRRCLNLFGWGWNFNEDAQRCRLRFDCEAFFRDEAEATTAAPLPTTTAAPPTTTEPAAPSTCTCAGDASDPFRLIRGDEQVEYCSSGYYCQCATESVLKCDTVEGKIWMFDEYYQVCVASLDCETAFDSQ